MGQMINWRQQRQTPRPEEVGQLLAQRASMGGMGGGMMSDAAADTEAPSSPVATAGPMAGEPDPISQTEGSDWPTSSAAALRAAILRGPAKPGENAKPPAPFTRTQLQRLGLPDVEIDALGLSGGSNV